MSFPVLPYLVQSARWPATGRHVLAAHDDDTVTVYQAFRSSIAEYAVVHGRFGGDFSFSRMSWVKPGFLWMMHRSGWATKEGQERILRVRIARAGFDRILSEAVESSYHAEGGTREEWQAQIKRSSVRLQWDPDHDPYGNPRERRALQLGLSGEVLRAYGGDYIRGIEDVTEFVREQHTHVTRHDLAALVTPEERVYDVGDPAIRQRLRLSTP